MQSRTRGRICAVTENIFSLDDDKQSKRYSTHPNHIPNVELTHDLKRKGVKGKGASMAEVKSHVLLCICQVWNNYAVLYFILFVIKSSSSKSIGLWV